MTELNALRLKDYLGHMRLAISRIKEYVDGHSEVEFLRNTLLQDAVIRNIEILGEASNNIMKRFPEFSTEHHEIPWEAVYYMLNRIIHGYATIDYELVWIVINRDIEDLDAKLRSFQIS